jgi:hypothetical protein
MRRGVQDQPDIAVWHFHGFMANAVARAGLTGQLPSVEEADLFTVFYPRLCLEALVAADATPFDALILDEAQDLLLESYVEVFDLIVRGGWRTGVWRAFLDPKQNIFGAIHPRGMKQLLDAHPAQYRLTVNCRNTAPIAVEAGLLSGIRPDETLVVAGPDVEVLWWRDAEGQVRETSRYLQRLLSGGLEPNDIVILSRRKLQDSSFSGGLIDVPYRLRELDGDVPSQPRTIGYCTIGGYKGLEADAILLTDVAELESDATRSALYVGASRARALLAVFISEDAREQYAHRAQEFGRILSSRPDVVPPG